MNRIYNLLLFVSLYFLLPLPVSGQTAASIMQKGIEYHNNKDYKNALAQYTLSIAIDQNNPKVFYNRGLTHEAMRNYDAAIGDYTQALFLEPTMTLGYFHRGSCYFMLRKYSEAITDLSKSLPSTDPNNYSFRAQSYYQLGNFLDALSDYSQAISLNPAAFYLYRSRADVHWALKDIKSAIQDYTSAIGIQPNSADLYMQRGQLYFIISNFSPALSDFSNAISRQPGRYDYYFYRSSVYEKLHQYETALADINKAIELQPADGMAFNNRGLIYTRTGRYDDAITDFKKAIQMDARNGKAYVNIVSPLVRLGLFSEAAGYFTEYKQKNLTSHLQSSNFIFYTHFMDAVQMVSTGNYAATLDALQLAVSSYGPQLSLLNERNFVDVISLQGFVLEKLNRFPEARIAWEKSLAIDKYQPDVVQAINQINKQMEFLLPGDKAGPTITLIHPSGGLIQTENITSHVIGRASDPSGIESIIINNVPVAKFEEDGIFVSAQELKTGINELVISATDKAGNKSTTSFSINAERGLGKKENTTLQDPNAAPPRYFAVLIAAKEYIDDAIPDLANPVNDARELKQILETRYEFSSENIDTVYNSNRETIMQAIVKRCNTLGPDDNLVIFYAGHGTAEKDRFGDVDGYWIPSSARKGEIATYISAEDINKAIKKSRARHVLLIADACFSGAFTRQLPTDASQEIKRQYAVPSRKVMASGNLEPVPDNSKFLFYLKKSLTDNTEKYLSAKDLYDSFYKAVLNNTENLPQYQAIKNVGDEGGEFIFIRR